MHMCFVGVDAGCIVELPICINLRYIFYMRSGTRCMENDKTVPFIPCGKQRYMVLWPTYPWLKNPYI